MQKKIVIIGAGFAGLKLARKLHNADYHITLIDIHNFHQFQPLFYQVASARLEATAISFPLRRIFQGKRNVNVRVGMIRQIDTRAKKVFTRHNIYEYDYLVIATGCTNNFFGNENIEQYAFPMKSTNQAIALRNKILLNFEASLSARTPADKEAYNNITIVGGGPTGVELAGALAEMKSKVLPKDYPLIDFSNLGINLIEGSPSTLSSMSEQSQKNSRRYLEEMGIKIQTNIHVTDYDGEVVTLENGTKIRSKTLIWAAGVIGNVPVGIPKECITRGNRLIVNEYHQVKGLDDVYAIGDISYLETKDWPKGQPQLAHVANKQAAHLSENFEAILKGRTPTVFTYKNPGTMATIGKRKAVVDLPKLHFHGRLAWLIWMFLHLMLILGVRNKLLVFINWMISYFTNDSTLRIILLPSKKQTWLGQEYDELSV
ncbi:NAD(P)/FAD-dependent oxidoreductase [Arachidicoccus ginsenosidivorans]|jgi:NADH dehydrogenase|uniref:NADH:ubiquinone reductase (non-electrogenic) n=1 Tax=Arachidicoccus ginsenosidivorans TaxID=496057 RepID=A0A5B8VQJ0_9BACT|nr:NAD(P)/FAD-dependent oxidoreductase [Arachidicoccus ginsenosidivorans]QEC72865.1 NAD(P)/FAD-dependent oxidoreductase [Arachidicoccus ginsenosidivorans]